VPARLGGPDGDAGTVTAELAVALPGVLLLAVALLVTGQAVIGEVRCTDAARAGARLAARGEPDAAIAAEVARLAPPGTHVSVARGTTDVVVSVSSPLGTPAPSWAGLTMHASATASVETTDP
jgi:hypothetical protein